jgi:hypothetical protein
MSIARRYGFLGRCRRRSSRSRWNPSFGDRNVWRQEIAERLSALGIHVEWQRMTVEEMLDLERAAKKHAR